MRPLQEHFVESRPWCDTFASRPPPVPAEVACLHAADDAAQLMPCDTDQVLIGGSHGWRLNMEACHASQALTAHRAPVTLVPVMLPRAIHHPTPRSPPS